MYKAIRQRILSTATLLLTSAYAFAQVEEWQKATDVPHLAAYLVAGLLIAVFVMTFTNRLYYYKEREFTNKGRQLNAQLALVLNSNRTQVWTYDTVKKIYKVLSSEGSSETEYQPIDFSQFFNHDDFTALRKVVAAVSNREVLSDTILIRGKRADDPAVKLKLYEINVSVLRKDRKNKPTILLGTQRDITDEQERQEKAKELSLRYHTVFNTSLVDMVYYDADGIMIDLNDKACETFDIKDRDQMLATRPSITDVPALQGLDFRHMEQMHSSSITELADIEKPIGGVDEQFWGNKIYYEQTLSPIHNEQGELSGIVMAGRNITEMVQSQHYQQWASKELEKTTREIQTYIDNINYSLRVSEVRLINYYPDTHELEIASDLSKTQFRLSQLRCIALVKESDRKKAKGLLRRMDRKHKGAFTGTVHTLLRDADRRDIYLNFNVIPVYDKNGEITHYFGMCRNDTEMTYTEMKLREETEKAQETELLKNTFLLNMSYEIRTPLNAVLGFAELFKGPHEDEDEPVFAEEIKKNTGELLRLINDILFMSRLDAHMVEITGKPTDFALLFDGFCYMGWSVLNPGVKVIVENPYSHLVIDIDEQHLGQVIQKLCAQAASDTKEGTIKAKYEYRHGELSVSIEDTSKGIEADILPKVFDRFVRNEENEHFGSGLDLPIVKELTEQMGGTIEIQSEKGKGTTVYLIFPCKMTSLEKKAEIIV